MEYKDLKNKAEIFLHQHYGGKILILPNIWNVLGAQLLEHLGYPSIATASASIAFSNGYDDGEKIKFTRLLSILRDITKAVNIPVSADIEKGYSNSLGQLKKNIRLLIESGIVGINIEDSKGQRNELHSIESQCNRIKTIRKEAEKLGIPLVINARTDVFLLEHSNRSNALKEAITRGKAYKDAGADCFYPILLSNLEDISKLVQKLSMPLNLFLTKEIADIKQLQQIGVARISLGPSLLKVGLSCIKSVAEDLLSYDSKKLFGNNIIASEYIRELVRKENE
ncbi:MAG: isocitrate lyase/phosphoenolpyruvate mutase family protein [Bacteroidetes bacterium]|nr:isocitrate lyase/phosphoenolpyruvate mutase family protein [Bacteroidota bacterium]